MWLDSVLLEQYWFWSVLLVSCSAVGVAGHRLELMGTLRGEIWAGPQLSVDFVTSGRKLIGNQPNYHNQFYAWFFDQICISLETNKLLASCQLISPDLIMHWKLTRRSQAWPLGRQSTDNAWFLQPCPPINMDRSSNWIDRVQLRTRLYKYP